MMKLLASLIPTSITKDQAISILGTLVKAIGSGLAARGVTISTDLWSLFAGPEALQFYAGIFLLILPMFRDWAIHSNAGKLAAASSVPGIEPIKVLNSAPPDIKAVAANPAVPMVVPSATVENPISWQRS